jgi:fatty acid desaturase
VPTNYHLEHHLYPGVPCYRLGRIHRLLKSNGTYQRESPPIESRFFGAYRKLAAPYEPGTDRDFDPLVKASP